MRDTNPLLGILGAASIAFGAGALWGMDHAPQLTERGHAIALTGDPEVRLIGTMCADHAATVVARWEDEFPLCKEIRRLKEE